jgi:hypothetical protein
MGPPYLVFLTQDIFDVEKDIYIDLTNNDRPIPEEFSTVPVCSLPISDPSD